MKKLLILVLFAMMAGNLKAQNNLIIQNDGNNHQPATQDNAYYINGISTRNDVGGVEIAPGSHTGYRRNHACFKLKFTNYNHFPVSVIFELEDAEVGTTTGTIVLNAGESKESLESYCSPYNFKLIARKMDIPISVYQSQPAVSFPTKQTDNGNNGQIKLGYVSSTDIIMAIPEYKTAQNKLKQLTDDLTGRIETLQNEFNTKLAAYKQQNSNLPPATREMQEKQLQDLSDRMNALQNSAQDELQRTQQKLMEPIIAKLQSAIESVGVTHGYSFIFDTTQNAILYKGTGATNLDNLVKSELGITN